MFEPFKPPPDGRELIGRARRRGRPAWDLYKDGDRVLLGWAVHSSDTATMVPLGTVDEVERMLKEWLAGVDPPFPLHQ